MPNHTFYKKKFTVCLLTTYKKNVKPDKNRRKIWRIIRILQILHLVGKTNNLGKTNNKIKKLGVIEIINIKEIESEILDETKAPEEIRTKLRKLETAIMKKGF